VVLGFVALVGVGLVSLVAGVELAAAAAGRHVDVWGALPIPGTHDARVLAIVCVVAGALALVLLILRHRPAPLVVSLPGGRLELSPAVLARLVAQRCAAHPDVVDTRCRFTQRPEAVALDVRAMVRPLAPADRLEDAVREAVSSALRADLGLTIELRSVRVKVLSVRELPRHLTA
jgi:hypothetical protein